ncbi:Neuronal membrane glycoprotein M6-a [Sarcoptes scabiei]|nr:Neuronal membrane glycoprotein M6-a [Sarcoptes scabiei]
MSCEICGATENLKSCGRCLQANYCSREHQLAHWKEHKRWCQQISDNQIESNVTNVFDSTLNRQNESLKTDDVVFNEYANSALSIDKTNLMRNTTDDQYQLHNYIDQPTLIDSSSELRFMQTQMPTSNLDEILPTNFDNQILPNVSLGQDNSCNQVSCHTLSGNFNTNAMDIDQKYSSSYQQNRDFVLNNLSRYCQIILRDMNKYGFCVIDDFLQIGDEILSEVLNLYDRGLFKAGQVVNSKENLNSKWIRGDRIIWVEGNERICSNIGFLVRILDSIISRCNSTALDEFLKYKITRRTKAMIACYPGNFTKYVRHVDNPNNDGRCITSIYYLNKDYNRDVCHFVFKRDC